MIVSDTTDLGYDFTHDLCKAIVSYCDSLEESNSNAFVYRGENLRFAVERQLYIDCINSEQLFRLYSAATKGLLLAKHEKLDWVFAQLAYHLLPREYWRKFETKNRVRRHVRHLRLRIMRNPLVVFVQGVYAARTNNRPRPQFSEDVLFHVVNAKFVRYLQPIIGALEASSAFLLAIDESLKESLEQQGVHYVVSKVDENSFEPVSKGLVDWPALVQAFDRIYSALASSTPKCMVVVEGNSPLDIVASAVCKQLAIPVICIQQGWSPYIHNGFRNMSFTNMLVWGDGFASMLKPYNPDQHFTSVGHHLLLNKISMKASSGHVDKAGISFFLQSPCALLSERRYFDFIQLIEQVAGTLTGTPVIVRDHPGYPLSEKIKKNLSGYHNIQLMPPDKFSLSDVFEISKIAVTVFSSTALESVSAGIVPIICNISSLPKFSPDIDGMGAGVEVKSTKDALIVINRLINDRDYYDSFKLNMEKFSVRFFSYGDPIANIMNEISSLIVERNAIKESQKMVALEGRIQTVYCIVPVHNRLQETIGVLHALAVQNYLGLKVLVVDDGSTDGTEVYLKEFFPDVEVIRGDGTLWWAGAIDMGIAAIRSRLKYGDYVLLQNNDTYFDSSYVSKLVEISMKYDGAIVGSPLRDMDDRDAIYSIGPRIDYLRAQICDMHPVKTEIQGDVIRVDALSGRGTLYPACVIKQVGSVKHKLLPHYWADYELSTRASRRGKKMLIALEAPVWSKQDISGVAKESGFFKTRFSRRSRYNIIDMLIFFSLSGPWHLRLTAIPRILIVRFFYRLTSKLKFLIVKK